MAIQGPLFKNNEGKQFYYSPINGRIIPVPDNLREECLKPEDGEFRFGYNKDKVSYKLKNCLDTLIIEGTQKCNLRCKYCIYSGMYNGERTHEKVDMDNQTVCKAAEYFINHSEQTSPLRFVSFYGGEPLMNFPIIEEISKRYQNKKRLRISIQTNGVLLKRYAQFLQKNNIAVALSIDGPKELHDRNRVFGDNTGSYDIIMEGLKSLDEYFIKRNVSFSATLDNPADLMQSYRFFASRFPYNAIRVGFVKTWDSKKDKKVRGIPPKIFNILAKEYEQAIKNNDMPMYLSFFFDTVMSRILKRGGKYESQEIEPRGFCIPGTRKLFVKQNGRFYTCEKLGYCNFDIGDVERGIDEKRTFELLDYVSEQSKKYCSTCWATPLCDSCIMLDACKEGVPNEERLKANCKIKRESIKACLGVYADIYTSLRDQLVSYLNKFREV